MNGFTKETVTLSGSCKMGAGNFLTFTETPCKALLQYNPAENAKGKWRFKPLTFYLSKTFGDLKPGEYGLPKSFFSIDNIADSGSSTSDADLYFLVNKYNSAGTSNEDKAVVAAAFAAKARLDMCIYWNDSDGYMGKLGVCLPSYGYATESDSLRTPISKKIVPRYLKLKWPSSSTYDPCCWLGEDGLIHYGPNVIISYSTGLDASQSEIISVSLSFSDNSYYMLPDGLFNLIPIGSLKHYSEARLTLNVEEYNKLDGVKKIIAKAFNEGIEFDICIGFLNHRIERIEVPINFGQKKASRWRLPHFFGEKERQIREKSISI